MRKLVPGFLLVLLAGISACQPAPTMTDGGRLIAESTSSTEDALPTLFLPPTRTPVIVPTSAPTQPPATEVVAMPIATADNEQAMVTLPPSKTPTITPTQTSIPTITTTPTVTVTTTPSPTSQQFAFRGAGQSTAAEATAYALNLQSAQQRADEQASVSSQNAFVPPSSGGGASSGAAPAANCDGTQWFFAGIPTTSCPSSQPESTNAAFQRFQYGYMFWLEKTDQIYVIYNSADMPRWQEFPDEWQDGMSECSQATAVNYADQQGWTPVQGFCLVWMGNQTVADRIGLSEDRFEYSFIARYQLGENGSIALEDNLGSIFFLSSNGTWDLARR